MSDNDGKTTRKVGDVVILRVKIDHIYGASKEVPYGSIVNDGSVMWFGEEQIVTAEVEPIEDKKGKTLFQKNQRVLVVGGSFDGPNRRFGTVGGVVLSGEGKYVYFLNMEDGSVAWRDENQLMDAQPVPSIHAEYRTETAFKKGDRVVSAVTNGYPVGTVDHAMTYGGSSVNHVTFDEGFSGWYPDHELRFYKPEEPKFKIGDLVDSKDPEEMKRRGLGIVVSVNDRLPEMPFEVEFANGSFRRFSADGIVKNQKSLFRYHSGQDVKHRKMPHYGTGQIIGYQHDRNDYVITSSGPILDKGQFYNVVFNDNPYGTVMTRWVAETNLEPV